MTEIRQLNTEEASTMTVKPKLFIGSSVEGLPIAQGIQANLERDAEITVWDQNVFQPSSYIMESLMERIDKSDFAILVLSPEDITKTRKKQFKVARDNVIFELGLFIGRLHKERVFFLIPRDQEDFHLPSDLAGITSVHFETDRDEPNWKAATAVACNQIRPSLVQVGRTSARTQAETLDDIVNKLRLLLSEQLSTEYIGEFPNFIESNICPRLANAKEEIYITCNVATHGIFSAYNTYKKYIGLLEEKYKTNVSVRIITLSEPHRNEQLRVQFSYCNTNEALKAKLEADQGFENRVISLATRAQMAITSSEDFFTALSKVIHDDINRYKSFFDYYETDQLVPINLWLVDKQYAVFSIPSYADATTEYGFATSSPSLVKCLLSIWNRYHETIPNPN